MLIKVVLSPNAMVIVAAGGNSGCHHYCSYYYTHPNCYSAPSTTIVLSTMASPHSYIDTGANLLDEQFSGHYNGSTTPKHPADLEVVLERAWTAGLTHIIITGKECYTTTTTTTMI